MGHSIKDPTRRGWGQNEGAPPSSSTLVGWHNSGPHPGFPAPWGRQTLSLSVTPFSLGRKWKGQNTPSKVGGWEGIPGLCLLGRWLAWGWSWYCWAWEGETEGGVGLVSVLPVVSVTCGTSQTYLWMAGPEELVEGPGQLVCPEPAPWGPGQQAVGQVALVHEGLMCEGGTQASPKPLYQPWEAPLRPAA